MSDPNDLHSPYIELTGGSSKWITADDDLHIITEFDIAERILCQLEREVVVRDREYRDDEWLHSLRNDDDGYQGTGLSPYRCEWRKPGMVIIPRKGRNQGKMTSRRIAKKGNCNRNPDGS